MKAHWELRADNHESKARILEKSADAMDAGSTRAATLRHDAEVHRAKAADIRAHNPKTDG